MAGVHTSSAAAVRLLAAWQQQRREVTDRLEGLLLHGPTAVSRVAARADELRAALRAEQDAFEAFVRTAQAPPGTAVAASPVLPRVEQEPVYPRLRVVPSDVG
ncbi:MAG: hypothetical protein JWO60_2403 [Frankiales bacterium]|nr:hypothetical protein [Frankiales bacterium]